MWTDNARFRQLTFAHAARSMRAGEAKSLPDGALSTVVFGISSSVA